MVCISGEQPQTTATEADRLPARGGPRGTVPRGVALPLPLNAEAGALAGSTPAFGLALCRGHSFGPARLRDDFQ